MPLIRSVATNSHGYNSLRAEDRQPGSVPSLQSEMFYIGEEDQPLNFCDELQTEFSELKEDLKKRMQS